MGHTSWHFLEPKVENILQKYLRLYEFWITQGKKVALNCGKDP